jgi:hypothetical protein
LEDARATSRTPWEAAVEYAEARIARGPAPLEERSVA